MLGERTMSGLAKAFVLLVTLTGLVTWGGDALAIAKYSRASAGWTTNSTWSSTACGGAANTTVPTNADDVIICAANTVTMNGNTGAARSLTISGIARWTQARTTNVGVGGITIPAGGDITSTANGVLTSTGGLTINATLTSTQVTITLQTTAAQTISGTGSLARLNVNTTVVATNTGNLTVRTALGGTAGGNFTNGTNSQLHYNSTTTIGVTTLDATASGNLVDYGAAGNQTLDIPATNTYYHLSLSGSGTKTMPAGTYTLAGDFTNSGVTYNGTTNNPVINLAGNFSNSGTFNSGTGQFTFNGTAAQSLTDAGTTTFNRLTIANTAAAVFVTSTNPTINVNTTLTVNAGAVISPAAAVVISDAGAGTITGAGTVQVTGTGTGDDLVSQYAFTTYTLADLTVDYAGAAAQTVSVVNYGSAPGGVPSGGLKISNANGVDLVAGSVTVDGTLALASGTVTTGTNTLITTAACDAPSVARTSGWVNGTLRKAIPNGASTCNFEVGDATNYTPVSTAFIAGTTAGNLTASTVGAQHPSISDPSSGLDTSKMVNRYWTLTNGGVGLPVGGYSATFNFINPGDLTAGANTANFEVENWSGAAWSAATAGARNTTNTTAAALTAFGAFAVGEKKSSTVVSINCSVSCAATSAATVSWTVTFNKSVTGVDATAFSLVPTGLAGAYITSVTGSGATWTVTANTGIGSGTLGLNQTGPSSVVPALIGTFTGQVYTISATPALAEYRMDEALWNGTANDVADSSGSGNNAQSFNSASTDGTTPAIATNPGTCRYGVFDNGTITQGYVQTPLPDLTTDFTITSWIRTANNAATGQRILLDDQNNTGGYGISLGDGAAGIIRFYSRGITPVILDSTYAIANNTWYFVAAVADIANQKRTIYVFDATGALLNSTTEAAWTGGAWGTDAGPLSIGGEVNGPPQTELPAGFHFRGNLDEVRVYQKVLSQAALAAIATQTHSCPVNIPDHLVIQSSGSGLTCAASTLTVVACLDASCATPYTLGVGGTLSATGTPVANWDGTTGGAAGAGFVIPAGSNSVTKNVQIVTAGSVVFGVSSASPTPVNSATCNFGSPVCTFTANTAGFIFSDTATPGNSYTIPPQVAGIDTPALYLRAVQASTINPAVCTPAIINQTTAVNMGYACDNPATCQAGSLAAINATAVAPGGTSVSLAFDANGSAPITARYDDAGQITLTANKTVTPFGGATAVTLNGSSNAYVVAPHHFGFSGIPAGPFKAGSNFAPSGAPYTTVTAYNGLATPVATANFGKEASAEGVTLSFAKCQPTGANSVNGAFSGSVGAFANGVANATSLNWSEVGNGDLVATLTSGSYLGSGLTATGNTSASGTACKDGASNPIAGNVGRFIPDHFDTVVGVSMACPTGLTCPPGGLVYSGQPFTINVYARNAVGALTQNYDGTASTNPNFAQAVTLTAWDALGSTTTQNPPALTPGSITGVSGTVAATSFDRGSTVLGTPAAPIYTFGTTPTSPTDIYIRAADADATSLRVPANTSVEGGIKVVNGRVRLSSAYGSELLPLPLTATAQYFTASGWGISITDSVTNLTLNASYPVGTGSTTVTPVTGILSSGRLTINLSAPGVTGAATITPTAPGYLPVMPGTAIFGVYKGNDIFIYMREAY